VSLKLIPKRGAPILPSIVQPAPDIILVADCVYFEPAFPLLQQTLLELVGDKTIVYFCFKRRRRADLQFIKTARKLFDVKEVLDDPERHIWSKEKLFL
jgi:protein N-lysine methyltransferase METTL21A